MNVLSLSLTSLLLVVLAIPVRAASVLVKPGQMCGWTTAVKSSTDGAVQPAFEFRSDLTTPPVGAFHATTGSGVTDPGQVWIGTDRYADIKLTDITKLQYTTYTFYGGDLPNTVVSEPIQLQLAVMKDLTYYRFLMYRPWGLGRPPGGSPSNRTNFDKWQTFDCLTQGVWYDPLGSDWSGTWSQLLARYPNAVIKTPCGGSGYKWPLNSICNGVMQFVTGTGTSLNFQVGARASTTTYLTDWYKESVNFSGLLDSFTIAFRDSNGKVTETTWDFDSGSPQQNIFLTSPAMRDPIINNAKNHFRFTVLGDLDSVQKSDWSQVTLKDRAGGLVKLWAPGCPARYYDTVRACGTLDNTTNPSTLICSGGDIRVASLGTPASAGPSMSVDPAFYYYQNRSVESTVEELKANGYLDVRLVCINESGISNSLVKQFASSGVKVWFETFTNGTYSTTDLPAGWESWQMVLRRPYSGFTYLCPNNPDYRAWKKTQVTNALIAHPFYGIDFAEAFFPGTNGPSFNYYGCLCDNCVAAFKAMYPEVQDRPDFENPASPLYYKTNTELYQKWINFRVATVTGFLDELVNGVGGVRERCPKARVSTWSLGLDTTDQLNKMKEYYGLDAAGIVQRVKPDMHCIQTDWPDWSKTNLPSTYMTAYRPILDSIRAVSPGTPVILQTDIGSNTTMRRNKTWVTQVEKNAMAMGLRGVTHYEYHLGKYMYTQPPQVVTAKWDAGKIKLVFQKRLEAVSATTLANYSLDVGAVTAATLDANIVRLTVSGASANPVVTVSNISDDESRRFYHDYPACVMTQSQQIRVED
jgi:hypothetical protein